MAALHELEEPQISHTTTESEKIDGLLKPAEESKRSGTGTESGSGSESNDSENSKQFQNMPMLQNAPFIPAKIIAVSVMNGCVNLVKTFPGCQGFCDLQTHLANDFKNLVKYLARYGV